MKALLKHLKLLEALPYMLRDLTNSRTTLSLAFAYLIPPKLRNLGFYPRIIKTVDNLNLYLNDYTTLHVNIPDQYIRREYELHPNYIPGKGWTVLDIGAYIGLYSLRVSKLVGSEGLVVAFEPNPYAFWWLKNNIKLNRVKNVKALPIALGDHKGFIELYIVTRGNIGASSMVYDHIRAKLNKEVYEFKVIKVPMYRLEDIILAISSLRACNIDLAKIDVEGAELKVLKGSKKLLEKHVIERFVIELHVDVVNETSIIKSLRNYDYKIDKLVSFGKTKKILYAKCAR